MKYRVEIDISFDNETDAIEIINAIEKVKGKVYIPTNQEKIVCNCQARYHKCYHDEINPLPCKDYVEVKF